MRVLMETWCLLRLMTSFAGTLGDFFFLRQKRVDSLMRSAEGAERRERQRDREGEGEREASALGVLGEFRKCCLQWRGNF